MKMDGYWVYTHTTPDGFVYVGRSGRKDTSLRWQPSFYITTSLYPYIEKWGWDNIRHFFIDGLTKEESFELEDKLIRMYKDEGVCINERYSGGLSCREKIKDYWRLYEYRGSRREYKREYRKAHRDEYNTRNREWRAANREEYNTKARAYWASNRDEINAKRRAKRATNRDEINAKRRAWFEANRDEINAKRRAWRAANRDEINAKQRAKRAAKKQKPYTYGDPLF